MARQLRVFLRASACELVLALMLSVGLCYAVLSGFDATMALRERLGLQTLVAGGMLAVLVAGSWSRGARAASIGGAVVYAAAALAVATALSSEPPLIEGTLNDVEGNYAVFAAVMVVVPLLVYLLSRTRAGCVALVLASTLCCGAVQFLFREWAAQEGGLIDFLVVLVSSVALLVYRRYRIGIAGVDHGSRPAFGQAALLGLGASACAAVVASMVFALVIAPLNLDTPILKPFEHRIVPPVVEYTGGYDQYLVENPDEFTSLLNEKEEATTRNAEGGATPDDEETPAPSNPLISFLRGVTTFNDDSWEETFDASTIERLRLGALLVALLVVLAAIVAVALRIRWRDVRLRKIAALPAGEQVVYLYDFIMGRLDRLGLGRRAAATPLEFAFDSRRALVPFTRGTGQVDLVQVTLIYQRAAYGSGAVSDDDLDRVRRYYRAFFGNAHRQVGTPRWLVLFWRV